MLSYYYIYKFAANPEKLKENPLDERRLRALFSISTNFRIYLSAYQTYVIPHLDYCCQIWSPGTQKWIQKIENVQKRALRLIPSLNGKSYEQKLSSLNLLSLENRRIMFDLTQKYREETSTEENLSAEQPTRVTRSKADKKAGKTKV